jgi:xanthine dehydrogenase YagT iron-sulfur-binding subunit
MPNSKDKLQHPESENSAGNPKNSDGMSRRSFLENLAGVGIVARAGRLWTGPNATAQAIETVAPAGTAETLRIALNINGRVCELEVEPRVTLLDALRENLGMFGTKKGCDHGQCGACTVLANGRRINACLTFAVMHQQDQITTIEGLANNGELHPVQAAFLQYDAFQCGYCTSGQIMSAVALLNEPCAAGDDAIRECMSGNICRCGAYDNIVAAVRSVRGKA